MRRFVFFFLSQVRPFLCPYRACFCFSLCQGNSCVKRADVTRRAYIVFCPCVHMPVKNQIENVAFQYNMSMLLTNRAELTTARPHQKNVQKQFITNKRGLNQTTAASIPFMQIVLGRCQPTQTHEGLQLVRNETTKRPHHSVKADCPSPKPTSSN